MTAIKPKFDIEKLNLHYGAFHALKDINMQIDEHKITAFIGPSGCGKSTFLKTLNRMNDLVEGVKIEGKVELDGKNIFKDMDAITLRHKVGMVFQQPNPFPKSIYDNVAYGPRIFGITKKADLDEIVERSLRQAAIWDELKDRLNKSALGLSGGQQQRLCIARTLAVEPEVILMDEPTSALDPISTSKIEDLAMELKDKYTIVIVTHNMQQAARISDKTAFFLLGEVVEYNNTGDLFANPREVWLIMRDAFLKQLEELHKMLAEMGNLCESMIDGAYEALMNMDREQAAKILAADANVDLKERDIESKCLKLLLEQQPVASDLRTISSTLKMITDLERIGDQAGDIAEIVKTTDLSAPVKATRLGEMAKAVASMVRESIESFANGDLKKTKEVIEYDDVIDNLFNEVKKELADGILNGEATQEQILDVLMIAKYLERIGDHATNIAEWAEYAITGVHRNSEMEEHL